LAQAIPAHEWPAGILDRVRDTVLRAAEAIIGARLTTEARKHIALPTKKGGLGLTDPHDAVAAARLAVLLNTGDTILQMANDPASLARAIEDAARGFAQSAGLSKPSLPSKQPHLQSVLTAQVHDKRFADFMAECDEAAKDRLVSLSSPHALAWTTGANPWVQMTPMQFRTALQWGLGLECTPDQPWCSYCGKKADASGAHFAKCQGEGAASKGHTLVKDVVAQIARDAGLQAVKEKPLPRHPELIPADLFLTSLEFRPLALDFTLWTRDCGTADPLDRATDAKNKRYEEKCQEEGWLYRVLAADLWGGMHPQARATTQKLIKALQRAERFEDDTTAAAMVW
jgi:hypothetical protein